MEEYRGQLEFRREELIKVIESFERLDKSQEWATLKELVFDKSVTSIERQLLNESTKPELDISKIYILQGERRWAKRFMDVNSYVETLKKELLEIKKKLNEQ